MIEEGAKYELEFFRVTPILSALGIPKLLDQGMIYTPFSDEIRDYMFEEGGAEIRDSPMGETCRRRRHGSGAAVQQERRPCRGDRHQSGRGRLADRPVAPVPALFFAYEGPALPMHRAFLRPIYL